MALKTIYFHKPLVGDNAPGTNVLVQLYICYIHNGVGKILEV